MTTDILHPFLLWHTGWAQANSRVGAENSPSYTKRGPGRKHRQGPGKKYSKFARRIYNQGLVT